MMPRHSDADKVGECIRQRYGEKLRDSVRGVLDYGWAHPVLNLIDCVPSLNRDYDQFARPRVKKFKEEHREVVTLRDLRDFICKGGGPVEFFRKELRYRDSARAMMFYGVLNHLIDIEAQFPGPNELRRISEWALSVSPKHYRDFGVFGFGLAGFQYLRMLFGVDTVKPDRYIRDFVKHCLGKAVSGMRALYLVETAARSIGYSPREVDRVIWQDYARNDPKRLQSAKGDAKQKVQCWDKIP